MTHGRRKKLISVLVVAFVSAALLRTFVLEGFIVRGDSMAPTILDGEYVIVNKLAYAFRNPERGDIVVANPRGERIKIIKRVIGMPGERFSIENDQVAIRVERLAAATVLNEGYLGSPSTTSRGISVLNIDPEEYFALGDNREVSTDSRDLGPIDKWKIKGKVLGAFNLGEFKYRGL